VCISDTLVHIFASDPVAIKNKSIGTDAFIGCIHVPALHCTVGCVLTCAIVGVGQTLVDVFTLEGIVAHEPETL